MIAGCRYPCKQFGFLQRAASEIADTAAARRRPCPVHAASEMPMKRPQLNRKADMPIAAIHMAAGKTGRVMNDLR